MTRRRNGLDGGDPASDRGAATLELVLRTSTQLFAERGFAATSMRQLADEADLPLSAYYYYFRRKYDVLLAIMDDSMSRLEAAAEAVPEEGLTARAQLFALVCAHVRVHLEAPDSARVTDGEIRALDAHDRDVFVRRRDAYERRFRVVLDEGVRTGEFAHDLDVGLASMSILTMGTGVVYWWRPDGRLSAGEIGRRLGAFAVALAGGRREAPLEGMALDAEGADG